MIVRDYYTKKKYVYTYVRNINKEKTYVICFLILTSTNGTIVSVYLMVKIMTMT